MGQWSPPASSLGPLSYGELQLSSNNPYIFVVLQVFEYFQVLWEVEPNEGLPVGE